MKLRWPLSGCLSVCRTWGIPLGRSEEREGILKEEGERERDRRESGRGVGGARPERERKYPPGR